MKEKHKKQIEAEEKKKNQKENKELEIKPSKISEKQKGNRHGIIRKRQTQKRLPFGNKY
jgi:hypothetical protein